MPSISVIIRCYNEEKHIGKLLSGITQQTAKDVEIIVVDSGSTDATVAIASRFPIKLVTIDKSEFTFGRSLNMGCAAATGDFLVMASAHVYPLYNDWLEKIIEPFSDPKIGVVYGRQSGNEITKYSEHQVFAQWFSPHSNLNQTYPFCNNANCAVRRELWAERPYDEALTGLEDIAWAKQAMAEGHKVAYSAEAEIVHVHEETPKRIYNRYRREAMAMKHIFPEQGFTFKGFLRLFLTNTASDYYHAFYDKALLKNLGDIPMFRLMQFWGTYRGYKHSDETLYNLHQTLYYPRELARKADNRQERESRLIDYQQTKVQNLN